VINEVQPGDPDAFEFYNAGNSAIRMGGWAMYVYDEVGYLDGIYQFPTGFSLGAGEYVVVHEGFGANTAGHLYAGFSFTIVNSEGAVALQRANGVGMDFVRWGPSVVNPALTGNKWFGANPGAPLYGYTLGRSPTSRDTDRGSDWCNQVESLGGRNGGCVAISVLLEAGDLPVPDDPDPAPRVHLPD